MSYKKIVIFELISKIDLISGGHQRVVGIMGGLGVSEMRRSVFFVVDTMPKLSTNHFSDTKKMIISTNRNNLGYLV